MKKFIVNEKSKQVMIENNVPEKLHNIVIGIIILITTDIERKYDKAKAIVETESINLSDNEIKLANDIEANIIVASFTVNNGCIFVYVLGYIMSSNVRFK